MLLVMPRRGIESTRASSWGQNTNNLDLQSSRSATNTIERFFPVELRYSTPICTDKQGRTQENARPLRLSRRRTERRSPAVTRSHNTPYNLMPYPKKSPRSYRNIRWFRQRSSVGLP